MRVNGNDLLAFVVQVGVVTKFNKKKSLGRIYFINSTKVYTQTLEYIQETVCDMLTLMEMIRVLDATKLVEIARDPEKDAFTCHVIPDTVMNQWMHLLTTYLTIPM